MVSGQWSVVSGQWSGVRARRGGQFPVGVRRKQCRGVVKVFFHHGRTRNDTENRKGCWAGEFSTTNDTNHTNVRGDVLKDSNLK